MKPFPDAPFGVGSGRVMLTSLNCNGNEIDIMQCGPDFGASSSCNHRKDAGVSCGGSYTMV